MSKKINVVHLIPSLNTGGAEKVVLSLCQNIDTAKFNITLVYWQEQADLLDAFQECPIQIHKLTLKKVISWDSVRQIRALLKETEAQIIHTHFIDADLLGFLASRFLKISMVSDIHSYPFPVKTSHRIRYHLMAYGIKKFLCVSHTVKKLVKKNTRIATQKINVIYNGIMLDERYHAQTDKGIQQLKHQLHIPLKHRVVGNISRLIPDKGQEYLIRAVPQVLKVFPQTTFIVIGDGELAGELKQLVQELQIQEHVFFTGTRHDIPELLSVMDLFVFPTFREAMGLTVLEAMAAGRPIIATDDAAIPELITHDQEGILIHPGDPDLIATAILTLLKDHARAQRYAQAARAKVKNFTALDMISQITKLYEEILP